jgi:hypothetical protein
LKGLTKAISGAVYRIRWILLLAHHFVIFRVTSNPEPHQSIPDFDRKGTIVQTNSNRTIFSDVFEVKGWMAGVCLQEFKAAVGLFLNGRWKLFVTFPKGR